MRPNVCTKYRTTLLSSSMFGNHLPINAACFPRRARTFFNYGRPLKSRFIGSFRYPGITMLRCKVKVTYNRPQRAHRGSRGIALLMLDLGARRGGWSAPRPGRFTPEKYPVPSNYTGGWVGPRAGLDVCEKSHPTGIRSPDRPARSQSIYRLTYPAHMLRYTASHIKRLGVVLVTYPERSNFL
jgi:hypothetical protein